MFKGPRPRTVFFFRLCTKHKLRSQNVSIVPRLVVKQLLVVVTHSKVNNTKVNSPWELCDRGACGHTLNTLPRSVIHT